MELKGKIPVLAISSQKIEKDGSITITINIKFIDETKPLPESPNKDKESQGGEEHEPTGPLLAVEEVAAYLKRAKKTIYGKIARGEFPVVYMDRRPMVLQSDLDKYIVSHRQRAARA